MADYTEAMAGYYEQQLSAQRLLGCYELATPRIRRYLAAEIDHVVAAMSATDAVLEMGCGYGRVVRDLAPHANRVVGIDTSEPSLNLGAAYLADNPNCYLALMDAATLAFADDVFDVVACIQNGLSAFKVDKSALIAECVRVTRPGGVVLFSSYAEEFWSHRLEWFQLQADHGLLGEIDHAATGDGNIVCKDGFTATTITPEQLESLTDGVGRERRIVVVDDSSVFCELRV